VPMCKIYVFYVVRIDIKENSTTFDRIEFFVTKKKTIIWQNVVKYTSITHENSHRTTTALKRSY